MREGLFHFQQSTTVNRTENIMADYFTKFSGVFLLPDEAAPPYALDLAYFTGGAARKERSHSRSFSLATGKEAVSRLLRIYFPPLGLTRPQSMPDSTSRNRLGILVGCRVCVRFELFIAEQVHMERSGAVNTQFNREMRQSCK
jgi:hypothetical protein